MADGPIYTSTAHYIPTRPLVLKVHPAAKGKLPAPLTVPSARMLIDSFDWTRHVGHLLFVFLSFLDGPFIPSNLLPGRHHKS